MDKILDEFLINRPQRLCNMCGKCCRLAVTSKTHQELCSLAESGDEGAIDFLKIFEPYPSFQSALDAAKDTVENIIDGLSEDGNYAEDKITFYKCRYIQEDNLCAIYKDRPELCDRFPSSPWAIVPPGCGFEGWLFQKREEKKQQIRKQKENLLSLEDLLRGLEDPEKIQRINETIQKTRDIIECFAKYGSENW